MTQDLVLGLPPVAIGAIAAALIAGIISLLGLIVSKEQKVSEFRQAWIDALRKDISELICYTNAIYRIIIIKETIKEKLEEHTHLDIGKFNQTSTSIRLRLNAKERSSRAILSTIDELESIIDQKRPTTTEELNIIERRLIEETGLVLKNEWNRVKRGELVYSAAKYLATAAIILSLSWLAINAIKRIYPGSLPLAVSQNQ
jgi:hypothetical protein